MGCDLRFLAFRNKPDPVALKAIPWLKAFRLYKLKGADQWFLEGPSILGDSITFFEPMHFDHVTRKVEEKTAAPVVSRLDAAITAVGGRSAFDDDSLICGLSISRALNTFVLAAFGNDEDWDGAFVCENGQLAGGRILVDNDRAMKIAAEGSSDVVQLRTADRRILHQMASEEAARFFGLTETYLYTSDPGDYDAAEYELVGSLGEAVDDRPKEHPAQAALWAAARAEMKPSQKIILLVEIIDRYVVAALRSELIAEELKDVAEAESGLHACFMSDFWFSNKTFFVRRVAPLNSFLSEVSGYLRALRPRPEYRKSINFVASRKRLKSEWAALKLKLTLAARFGF
jgi:hypothetical protein